VAREYAALANGVSMVVGRTAGDGMDFLSAGSPGSLQFTDGLVGHSFVAMAGFTSSLLIFVMVQLLGDGGWIFNRTRSFYLWMET